MSHFNLIHRSSNSAARTGKLSLAHGELDTPVFMPVGTNATVKAMNVEALEEIGFKLILSNTYHLYLRPGVEVIERAGGLHRFMSWNGNILTDSGGFQVFSLAPFRKISVEGVKFRSHIDGAYHLLSPEKAVSIQTALGSDIQMQLDVCTAYNTDYKKAEKALELTSLWLQRAKACWQNSPDTYKGLLFGIVQGNFYENLRKRSVEEVSAADLPGIAIGGLSVGEPFSQFRDTLSYTAALLPENKPRYVMGIGTPEFILEAVENGIDMFDCVFPTRTARNGLAFSYDGPLSIKRESNKFDFTPLEPVCNCAVCRKYSRAYLRHLYKSGEILASMLMSYHNLSFIQNLTLKIRESIMEDRFMDFKNDFLQRYRRGFNE